MDNMLQDNTINKKVLVILLTMIIVFVVAFAGCSNNKVTKKSNVEDSSSRKQTIAIVNQDVGVEYSGKIINYSEEFVKTLDEKTFKLVSSIDAEEGLKNGTYAGIIVFPGNLSSSILSINYKNPQTINLEYSISKKEKFDDIYFQIYDVYNSFNNKLSYAYINALMDEVELGQYNIKEVFNNDGNNLAAARKVAEGNYRVEFKEPTIPMEMPEFKEQNTDAYQNSGNNYADEIDDLFKTAYASAHKSISDEINIDIDIKAVDDSVSKVKEMLRLITKYADSIADFNTRYDIYLNDLSVYQKSVDDYEASVTKYQEMVDEYLISQNPTDIQLHNIDNAKNDLKVKKEALNAISEKIKGKSPTISFDEVLPTKEDIKSIENSIQDAVAGYQEKLRLQSSRLAPNEFIKSAMDESVGSNTYKSKIDNVRNAFIKDAQDTSSRFNKIQEENRTKLDEAYSLNSKFVSDTVKILNETNLKDHDTLGESVTAFINTVETNSKDTRSRLSAFEGMLSNAKVNGRVSSDVMKFLIRPVKLVEKNTVN